MVAIGSDTRGFSNVQKKEMRDPSALLDKMKNRISNEEWEDIRDISGELEVYITHPVFSADSKTDPNDLGLSITYTTQKYIRALYNADLLM